MKKKKILVSCKFICSSHNYYKSISFRTSLNLEECLFDKTSSSIKNDRHWRTYTDDINTIPVCESDIPVEHNTEIVHLGCHDDTSSVSKPHSESQNTCDRHNAVISTTCDWSNVVSSTTCDWSNVVTSTTCDWSNVVAGACDYHEPTTNYHQTCRQQATAYDDITVDDLAGYLDELLYLPRPMSDMAELMYT